MTKSDKKYVMVSVKSQFIHHYLVPVGDLTEEAQVGDNESILEVNEMVKDDNVVPFYDMPLGEDIYESKVLDGAGVTELFDEYYGELSEEDRKQFLAAWRIPELHYFDDSELEEFERLTTGRG